jgi:hypothetical protein
MKINATKFYTTLFVLAVFSQLYVSSFRINILFQLLLLAIYFFIEKPKVSKSFLFQVLPLCYIFIIGFVVFFFHKYQTFNLLKDIFHFIKPILGILIGYFFYKKINNLKLFFKTIVICGLLSALIHLIILLTLGDAFSGNLESIREYSKDNFLELFALFFLLYYHKFENQPLFSSKSFRYLVLSILIISCVLYFSRTMIIVTILLSLTFHGFTIITKQTLKVLGFVLLSLSLFYVYLFSVKIERKNSGLDSFLYKIKIAPSEIFTSKIDRENHKDLWDHWRAYEAKRAIALMNDSPTSFIIGTGQGSLVNLKFEAPLTGQNEKGLKFISELHNGYVYVFYKTGILFLFSLYKLIYFKQDKNKFSCILISAIGLFYLFTTLIITGIYNARDVIIFILGALLYFHKEQNQNVINR